MGWTVNVRLTQLARNGRFCILARREKRRSFGSSKAELQQVVGFGLCKHNLLCNVPFAATRVL